MPEVTKVLFVCLGNICRSPIAEAVFAKLIKERGIQDKWEVDSAAIGPWHIGRPPDLRARTTLRKFDVPYNGRARQIAPSDFKEFHYIFGMDYENMTDLKSEEPSDSTAKILLLGSFNPDGEIIIRDPYYDSNVSGFEKCYHQCVTCCNAFLDKHCK